LRLKMITKVKNNLALVGTTSFRSSLLSKF
jgi:hypothetical protein